MDSQVSIEEAASDNIKTEPQEILKGCQINGPTDLDNEGIQKPNKFSCLIILSQSQKLRSSTEHVNWRSLKETKKTYTLNDVESKDLNSFLLEHRNLGGNAAQYIRQANQKFTKELMKRLFASYKKMEAAEKDLESFKMKFIVIDEEANVDIDIVKTPMNLPVDVQQKWNELNYDLERHGFALERFAHRLRKQHVVMFNMSTNTYRWVQIVKDLYISRRNELLKKIKDIRSEALEEMHKGCLLETFSKAKLEEVENLRKKVLRNRAKHQFRNMKRRYDGFKKIRTCTQVFRLNGLMRIFTKPLIQIYGEKVAQSINFVRGQVLCNAYNEKLTKFAIRQAVISGKPVQDLMEKNRHHKLRVKILQQKLRKLHTIIKVIKLSGCNPKKCLLRAARGKMRLSWYPLAFSHTRYKKRVVWCPLV